jgi:hypothetical protein
MNKVAGWVAESIIVKSKEDDDLLIYRLYTWPGCLLHNQCIFQLHNNWLCSSFLVYSFLLVSNFQNNFPPRENTRNGFLQRELSYTGIPISPIAVVPEGS